MKEKIINVVIDSLKELIEEEQLKGIGEVNLDTPLYGFNGDIDSLMLVRLLSEIEFNIEDEFDKEIVLANEKAMSQKLSPFRSVRSLSSYIEKLLIE